MSALHNGFLNDELVKNAFTVLKENAVLSRHEKSTPNDSANTPIDVSLSSQRGSQFCDINSQTNEFNLSSAKSSQSPLKDLSEDLHNMNIQKKDNLEEQREKSGSGLPELLPDVSIPLRPESLPLPIPSHNDKQEQSRSNYVNQAHGQNYIDDEDSELLASATTSKPIPIRAQANTEICALLSSSLPQGTITRKGDMIQFVADNLQEKIKQSSPMSNADNGTSGSRRSSERSIYSFSSSTSFATSSGVSRSPSSQFQQSPDDIPPIDVTAVIELESHARKVADNLDLMMGNIRNNLHKMSAITIGCQDAYKRSVDITCDSVDASIKSMYALMAKCEELSAAMGPVEQLAGQIKEIKRILDLFESQLSEK
ncbi:uncharacterized protein LOC106075863 [Biomphalaria glabrata]|uniref:Uncharacterized protein LOC106075863 n=1 Tax=Biomphalaria glabrata TaxID=6526 RepID=A0A9W3A4D9_BIOGL|nr:uncharacterized protein LOC106075863 [Biomphalaria glabrata]XP_055882195.1 uncharacterized protein LOC106075863 [Biomphalaria glabrata]XP_055882196.1 uncharacterized protein LOC106075863 [Biomphalaria glabrata]XP_055882197.1 uncharacterized protein LOC106075863 [Biomphalaria glabrata]XP_055882198.1 uncharacterized protein LOC106075863 [Biomphalaria glabrata]